MRLFGFINLDKPAGKTSHDMVYAVRRLLPRKTKVGHAGTLDPFATGVLVICVGQATKLADYVAATDKQYLAEITFGATSDTDDVDGRITPTGECPPGRFAIEKALTPLIGDIMQTPPNYSAVHVDGKRAYERARSGEELPISARRVRISNIELLNYADGIAELLIDCGKGTYIRSVARDLGLALGCGAYCRSLRRTRIGRFEACRSISPDGLDGETIASRLESPAKALVTLPQYRLSETELDAISYGKSLRIETPFEGEAVAAVGTDGELAAICEPGECGTVLKPKRVFVTPK